MDESIAAGDTEVPPLSREATGTDEDRFHQYFSPRAVEGPEAAATTEPPPVFPRTTLPTVLRNYAEAMAGALPCPFEMVAVSALGAAATAIGNTRHIRVKSTWSEPAQLWLALLSEPGTKKSPALNAAIGPLRRAQAHYWDAFERARVAYEQLHAALGDDPVGPTPPTLRQVFTTDSSRPGLITLLRENPRGVGLFADELQSVISGFKKGDESFLLSVWSGADFMVNRGHTPIPSAYLRNPFVSLVGCMPPATTDRLNTPRFIDSGFVDRILFAWVEPTHLAWSESEPEPSVLSAYDELFAHLLALEPARHVAGGIDPVFLDFTPAGKTAWVQFLDRHQQDSTFLRSTLRGAWARMERYCARLALVLHVVRFVTGETAEQNVDEVSVDNAAQLIEYFQAGARRVREAWAATVDNRDEDVEAVWKWIRRHRDELRPTGKFRWQAIRHDLHNRFGDRPEALRAALSHLEHAEVLGQITPESSGKGRPPEPDFVLNPSIFLGQR